MWKKIVGLPTTSKIVILSCPVTCDLQPLIYNYYPLCVFKLFLWQTRIFKCWSYYVCHLWIELLRLCKKQESPRQFGWGRGDLVATIIYVVLDLYVHVQVPMEAMLITTKLFETWFPASFSWKQLHVYIWWLCQEIKFFFIRI